MGETVSDWKKGNSYHSINLTGSFALSENSGYKTGVNQFLRLGTGYFFDYSHNTGKSPWKVSLAVKEEWNHGKFSIPIVQSGINIYLWEHAKRRLPSSLILKFNAGTVYRFPTLNDRYWVPGGNPDLKPEKGFSGNATANLELKHMNFPNAFVKIDFTHFQRYVYDWIMWQPRNGYWTPQNLLTVWSRGNETEIHIEFGKKVKTFVKGNFNYTLSSQVKSEIENDNSIGRQLIYSPMYMARGELGLKVDAFELSGNYSYYGYRYTSSDNYEYLEPFHLLGARVIWGYNNTKYRFNFYAEADNLLNTTYYWVAQRPALPRNFNVGLIVKFTKK